MDHQRNVAAVAREKAIRRFLIAYVEVGMAVSGNSFSSRSRRQAVEASGPKKYARMSLSRPTTSKPSREK